MQTQYWEGPGAANILPVLGWAFVISVFFQTNGGAAFFLTDNSFEQILFYNLAVSFR